MSNRSTDLGSQPAFPMHDVHDAVGRDGIATTVKGGLTKRELFAAMAMQGFVSNPGAHIDAAARKGSVAVFQAEAIVKASVEMADALLAALDVTP